MVKPVTENNLSLAVDVAVVASPVDLDVGIVKSLPSTTEVD